MSAQPEPTTTAAPPEGSSGRAPLLAIRDLRTYFHTPAGIARSVDGG